MVKTVPSSDQVQSPVVPVVTAAAGIVNTPIGNVINIIVNAKMIDNVFFTKTSPF
jgi:hypothetical protein